MKSRLAVLVGIIVFIVGCSSPAVRSQSPEVASDAGASKVKTVGDLAVPFGMHAVEIESVGLVTGLDNTGSDPPPSPQRGALLSDMQARGVLHPNQVLASPATALVLVRGFLRPGIQQGDRFDLEIRVPSRSETTSLQGGWLMETRLKEMAVLNQRIRDGHVLGMAEGAVLIDPGADEGDRVAMTRGRILGGGVALKSRPLGLVLKPERQSVAYSGLVGTAINRRFHKFRQGVKEGVATPKTDEYIEISVHARYKDNIARYMQVLRAIPLRETAKQQVARLALLQQQLLDPVTSASAAIRLEAIGHDAVDALVKGIESSDPEVRFYAAEALAYMDDARAVEPLVRAARDEPAFRVFALTALSAMDDLAATEGLRSLLDVSSVETRYGAFRALWASNARDAMVRGEYLGEQFSYHVLDTEGPALIHLTRSYRPELVVFGHEQRFRTPLVLEAGKHILVTAKGGDEVTVSRFYIDKPDQKRVVSTKVDDVIRAVVELGGTYPDVVQALQQAKASHSLTARLEVDALPQAGRTYVRSSSRDSDADDQETAPAGFAPSNPLPDLFPKTAESKESQKPKRRKPADDQAEVDGNNSKNASPLTRWFGRI